MHIIITGNPVEGFEAIGPFENDTDAISWAANVLTVFDWVPMKLNHPDPSVNDDEESEAIVLTGEELEELLKRSKTTKDTLPKQVMLDLSEIPVGI